MFYLRIVCRTRGSCVKDHSQALTEVCRVRTGGGGVGIIDYWVVYWFRLELSYRI